MSYGSQVLSSGVKRTLIVQIALTSMAAIAFLAFKDVSHAGAALYGGTIAVIIAALLGWRVERAASLSADEQKQQGTLQLAVGAFERFIVVGIGFGIGIAVLKLPPVAMIATFAVAQLSFLMRVPTRLEQHKNRGVAP